MSNAFNRPGPIAGTTSFRLANKDVPWATRSTEDFSVNKTARPQASFSGQVTELPDLAKGRKSQQKSINSIVSRDSNGDVGFVDIEQGIVQVNADPFLPMYFLFRERDETPGIEVVEETPITRSGQITELENVSKNALRDRLGVRNPQVLVDSATAVSARLERVIRRNRDIVRNINDLKAVDQGEDRSILSRYLRDVLDETLFALWVNPNNFQKQITKVQSTVLTRNEVYARHYWGEEQPIISMSGFTPAYFTAAHGLTRANRSNSAAFQNFLQFVSLYRRNTLSSTPTGFPLSVGTVYIMYDGRFYEGSFESLSFSEDANKPFLLQYQFTFVVRAVFRLIEPGTSETPLLSGSRQGFRTDTSRTNTP